MKYFIIGLLLTIIGLFAYVFFTYFERVEVVRDQDYQGIAKQNNLLALQRLLDKMHVDNRLLRQLSPTIINQFQPQDTLVFSPQSGMVLMPSQAEQLLDWVKRGGHLIMTSEIYQDIGETDITDVDPLLEALHIIQYRSEPQASEDTYQISVEAWHSDDEATWSVEFSEEYYLRAAANYPAQKTLLHKHQTDNAAHVLRYDLEKGAVTVTSDLWFINNIFIDQQDHAPFFWALLHQHHQPQTVWLINPLQQSKSLLSLIWLFAAPLVISLVLLLLLWLWRISYRFGSIEIETQSERRSLLEHIEASAAYLWRHRCQQTLLQPLQQHVQTQHRHQLSEAITVDPATITTNQQLIDTVKRLKDLS